MAAALALLLTSCLLQGSISSKFKVTMPETMRVLSGSCVTIPCEFDIESKYDNDLDTTCHAEWRVKGTTVFDSTKPKLSGIPGTFQGNLQSKTCTTTLNRMLPDHANEYVFRVECNNDLKWTFGEQILNIKVEDEPPSPTLSPATLEVMEGTTVRLKCSAPAPCLFHPPTLSWSPRVGEVQETLQENPDKTKFKTSEVSFTASALHHGQRISCAAVYPKQGGSKVARAELTAHVLYPPRNTTASISSTGPVPEDSIITLTCSSSANPAVRSFSWHRADRDQETQIGSGHALNILASKVLNPVFCKAENHVGTGRSDPVHADVQYPPRNTIASISSTGPVPEDSIVTLTCSSSAKPDVHTFTWHRADGDQETQIGSGRALNVLASKVLNPVFCKAQNRVGTGRSDPVHADVQFAPRILASSDCTKSAQQLNCSCETVANPAPTLGWLLSGVSVNQSDDFTIDTEPVSAMSVRSIITVSQTQWTNLSTLMCHSSNTQGSATQRFYIYSLEPQASEGMSTCQLPTLPVFIATVGVLLIIVCVLLLVIRVQKTHHSRRKSAATESQPATTNERPSVTEDSIYANVIVPTQAHASHHAATHEAANSINTDRTKSEEDGDVTYSVVKRKSKWRKGDDNAADVNEHGASYLEEERSTRRSMGRNVVSNALQMGSLYDEAGARNVNKGVECEYAQVKFKSPLQTTNECAK